MRQVLFQQGIQVSKEAINKRINKKLVFVLRSLLKDLLKIKLDKLVSGFSSIVITDATSFELPECYASKYKGFGGNHGVRAGVKIQHQLSITDGKAAIEVSSATKSDFKGTLIRPRKGELHLFDLGYFEFPRFTVFEQKQAYYLCRLKLNTVVWINTEQGWTILDWVELNRKISVSKVLELQVRLGNNQEISTRMFVKKLSTELAARKRKELKRYCQRHRNTPTKKRLAICDLSIHITNAPQELIDKNDVLKVYSLRWQIELQFKTWKSFMNIHRVRSAKIERLECQLYGSLIYCLTAFKITFMCKIEIWIKYKIEISELKAMQFLSTLDDLMQLFTQSDQKLLNQYWKQTKELIKITCKKESKNKLKTPMNTIAYALS